MGCVIVLMLMGEQGGGIAMGMGAAGGGRPSSLYTKSRGPWGGDRSCLEFAQRS
jgi:hypothetical protein